MEQRQITKQELENLQETLVGHGYAFHQRAIREADAACRKWERWRYATPEFPVRADRDTRIDFVLRCGDWHLTVECKRTNPDYSQWFFAKFHRKGGRAWDARFLVDGIRLVQPKVIEARCVQANTAMVSGIYRVGMIVDTTKCGRAKTQRKDELESAIRQAVRGANGLVNYWIDNTPSLQPGDVRFVIPVVFTTAELIVTDVHLGEKTSLDGVVEAAELDPHVVPWLFYEFSIEPGLRHQRAQQLVARGGLEKVLERQYARTVPIVNTASIDEFLSRFEVDEVREILKGD